MNSILSIVGAGLLAILSVIGLFQIVAVTPLTLFLAIIILLIVNFGGYLSISRFLKDLDKQEVEAKKREKTLRLTHEEFTGLEGLSGINVEDFKSLVRESRNKLRAIVDVRMRLTDIPETAGLLSLGSIGNNIINEIKRDPKDYRLARSWFNTYLDQTVNIATKYEAAVMITKGDQRVALDKEFKETIDKLEVHFSNLLEDLRSNDLTSLKIDMEVLGAQLQN